MTLEEKEAYLKELQDRYQELKKMSDKLYADDRRIATIATIVIVVVAVFGIVAICLMR